MHRKYVDSADVIMMSKKSKAKHKRLELPLYYIHCGALSNQYTNKATYSSYYCARVLEHLSS